MLACLAGVMAMCVRLCQVASNVVDSIWQVTPPSSEITCSGEL